MTEKKTSRNELFPGIGSVIRERFALGDEYRAIEVGNRLRVTGTGPVSAPSGYCFVTMHASDGETLLVTVATQEYHDAEQASRAANGG